MKYIPFIVLAAVLIAVDSYAFYGLSIEPVASHRADSFFQYFSGSVLDWISFSLFNGAIISYAVVLIRNKSYLSNEVGSSGWNYFLAGALACSFLIAYLG